ncbi:MAG: hypothetical protein ACRD1H_21055 [Vicinamibacterales bacterium]
MQATTAAQTIDTSELAAQGFSPEQIERPVELRAVYPLIEMVENSEQLRRIVFLKWLREHRADPVDTLHAAA